MKKIFSTIAFCFSLTVCFSQPGEWVWIKGDSAYQFGYYGSQGVPALYNIPPSMYEPCEWTDLNGNFWLFGGVTGSDYFGDLWKYTPATNEWTWMKGSSLPNDTGNYGVQGIASPLNNPPSRSHGIASWVDSQNNLWMFGGQYGPLIFLNYSDLWKYNILTNQWTWMKCPGIPNQPGIYGTQGIPDPANNPSAKAECPATWVDNSGDFWMFGGNGGYDDLWKYNIASNQWTWMRGLQSSISYGIKNVESTFNTPGSRWTYSHWQDNDSRFWLFGGVDIQQDVHNDLWRYNPLTNNWTWINGDSAIGGSGYYNTKCAESMDNLPLARFENRACWTDPNGNFWFFGGTSYYDHSLTHNDLWMYCVATNQWIWQNGDSISNPIGNWGALGVSSSLNKPNGRSGSIGWSDGNGHLYLYGGSTSPFPYPYSDLWKYTIDTTCGICPTPSGTTENNISNQVQVFPNPATNELTVFDYGFQKGDEIILTDAIGKIIFRKKINAPASEIKIQTLGFSNGIYFILLNSAEKHFRSKFIKQ